MLGVVNLSATSADGPLVPDALARVVALSHRFGVILDRFLRLQDSSTATSCATWTRAGPTPEQAIPWNCCATGPAAWPLRCRPTA